LTPTARKGKGEKEEKKKKRKKKEERGEKKGALHASDPSTRGGLRPEGKKGEKKKKKEELRADPVPFLPLFQEKGGEKERRIDGPSSYWRISNWSGTTMEKRRKKKGKKKTPLCLSSQSSIREGRGKKKDPYRDEEPSEKRKRVTLPPLTHPVA